MKDIIAFTFLHISVLIVANLVCSVLSAPDSYGLQSCVTWVEISPMLPPLSQAEANEISAAIAGLFITVFIGKRIIAIFR